MGANRSGAEELAFQTAAMDAALRDAGFLLAYSDPEAPRDLGYRARYVRGKSAQFPLLNASIEYYLASKAFSLKISPSDDAYKAVYTLLAKNQRGDLKELLVKYFASVQRGEPLRFEEPKSL